jgi:hypothetical protein
MASQRSVRYSDLASSVGLTTRKLGRDVEVARRVQAMVADPVALLHAVVAVRRWGRAHGDLRKKWAVDRLECMRDQRGDRSLPLTCAFEHVGGLLLRKICRWWWVGEIWVILLCIVMHGWVNASNGRASRITCHQ